MKTLISVCAVLSIAVVTHGQMPDFGGIFKQAAGMASSMIPGMGGGDNPMAAMMQQMQGMMGNPEQMIQLFQDSIGKLPEAGQAMMGQFMEQMTALKDQGAPQDKYMALMKQMQKAAGH